MFIGNEAERVVHSCYCEYAWKIKPSCFVVFDELAYALANEYQCCWYCLDKGTPLETQTELKARISREVFDACALCDEERGVQKAHLIAKKDGGKIIVPMCPTCHWNYDHDLLGGEEEARLISWVFHHLG